MNFSWFVVDWKLKSWCFVTLQPLVDDLIRDPRNGTLDPLRRELERLQELKERILGRVRICFLIMPLFRLKGLQ